MVRQMSARELASQLATGAPLVLLDVRQPWERALAALPHSLLIPLNDLAKRAGDIDAEAGSPIVVYCHHGIRSLSAGAFLERLGFSNVYSLTGGIDAWSCEVDPTLPRY
jgi:adenylyltransferase/sulfurtransferase